jgi:hypothetical protein
MPHVINAIRVIMGQHSVSEEEAKKLCHGKIFALVQDYKVIVEQYRKDDSVCLDLKRYIEALQYYISGNLVWSLTCPRYHPETEFNACQTWMQKRIAQNHQEARARGMITNLRTWMRFQWFSILSFLPQL